MDLPGATGGVSEPFAESNRRIAADRHFLATLARCDAANMPLSPTKSSSNFAAKVFAKRPDSGGFNARDMEAAMHRLLTDGRIVLASYGRPGDERRRIAFPIEAGMGEGVQDADLS